MSCPEVFGQRRAWSLLFECGVFSGPVRGRAALVAAVALAVEVGVDRVAAAAGVPTVAVGGGGAGTLASCLSLAREL